MIIRAYKRASDQWIWGSTTIGKHPFHIEAFPRNQWVYVAIDRAGGYRLVSPLLTALAVGVLEHHHPVQPLLDALLEWEGWANDYDRDRFRKQVEEVIAALAQEAA